jgi:hypothetical protein
MRRRTELLTRRCEVNSQLYDTSDTEVISLGGLAGEAIQRQQT